MSETQSQNLPLVLVVDDEQIMQDVMRDILQEAGYEVDVADNGQKALEQLKKKVYGLVFADVRMPKMDGMEFLRRAKHLTPGLDVILMTGYASVDVAVEAMKLGALDFITKPFNMDHVRIVAARAIERKMLKRQADEGEYYKKISLTDGLTELYNHRHFHHLLSTELNRSERNRRTFCLLMIDVDNFKIYNDSLGHPAGDQALKFLAWLLKHHARASDVVCRYGGEEFTMILPETNTAAGKMAAERLRQKVEEAEFYQQDVMPSKNLTVSIGVACFPDDAQSAEELLSKADQALYQAKKEGKNRIVTWAEMYGNAAVKQTDKGIQHFP
jgi:diguanylate cyclase (GGDEF)-like protein